MRTFFLMFGGFLMGGPIGYLFMSGQPLRASMLIVGGVMLLVGANLDD